LLGICILWWYGRHFLRTSLLCNEHARSLSLAPLVQLKHGLFYHWFFFSVPDLLAVSFFTSIFFPSLSILASLSFFLFSLSWNKTFHVYMSIQMACALFHCFTLVVICVVQLLFVLFYVLFVCKCVLPLGDNPIPVNKYIIFSFRCVWPLQGFLGGRNVFVIKLACVAVLLLGLSSRVPRQHQISDCLFLTYIFWFCIITLLLPGSSSSCSVFSKSSIHFLGAVSASFCYLVS